MDKEKVQLENGYDQSPSDANGQVTETRSGKGTMIVGVSNRLAGVFIREEEQCDPPADFEPRNDDNDWLGVD